MVWSGIERLGPSHCRELAQTLTPDQSEAAREQCQAQLIESNFAAMSIPAVALWTQYKINDQASDVTTSSGLRRDFQRAADGTPLGPGAQRPAWHVWQRL